MPVVGRGDNAAVFVRGANGNAVGFEGVESHSILWAVWFAQAIGELDDWTGFECGFEFIGEHALPAYVSHGGVLL